ncbi:CAAX amino protease [Alloscardovia macacae]|uniref:CAAX amino protease n=2 Tax=Alloscardovia macacae TaxID=1160091 RepID=A0A261F6L7_9BIFI|nr:CAAX amino protease [Alloscardovia macacae]
MYAFILPYVLENPVMRFALSMRRICSMTMAHFPAPPAPVTPAPPRPRIPVVTMPELSYTAPRIPDPPATTYRRPEELVRTHQLGWLRGASYASTLRDTARNPRWTPLATVPIFLVIYNVFSLAVLVAVVFSALGQLSIDSFLDFTLNMRPATDITADPANATVIIFQFGSVAIMLPGLWWTLKIMKRQSFGSLSSVFGHLRWAAVLKSTLVAFVLFAGLNAGSVLVDIASGAQYSLRLPSLATLLLAVTLVPVQCATEEYVFRGLLLQAAGLWIPRSAHFLVPILPALIFTSLHMYDLVGLSTIFTLGLITGYLTMYLGGLEAGIGMHVANNVTIVLFEAFGFYDASGEAAATPVWTAVVDITVQLLIAAIIVWGAKKRHWFDAAGPDHVSRLRDTLRSSYRRWQDARTYKAQLKRAQKLAMQQYRYSNQPRGTRV